MKYSIIIFILFYLIGFSLNVQAQKQSRNLIDSLQIELNNYNQKKSELHKTDFDKSDTVIVDILIRLSGEYIETMDFTKSRQFIEESYKISNKIGFKRGIASYYNTIGNINSNQGNYTDALKFHFNSLKIRKEIGNKRLIAGSLHNIGNVYYFLGNYSESLKYYYDALKLNEEIDNKIWIVLNYLNIGGIYEKQNNYSDAIKSYLTSVKFYKEIGDQNGVAEAYNYIGLAYMIQQKYSDALENFLTALKLNKALGFKEGLVSSYNNLGQLFEKQGKYSDGLKNYLSALEISQEIKDQSLITQTYISIGGIYINLENYTEALKNYFAAIKIFNEIDNKSESSKCYIKIGSIYVKLRNFSEAYKYLNKALSISIKIGNKENIKSSYLSLSALDSVSNNWKEAFIHHKLFILYNDSLINVENTKKMVQTQMQFEFDKKEIASKADQDKKDIVQRNIRNSIVGGLVIALFFLGIVFRQRNKVKREKANVVIEKELNEQLLLNILPVDVANELKFTGNSIAKQYNNTTVLFTDFVNFTGISEQLSPIELVAEIHKNFSAFDSIIEKNGLEKIKTIGDAYLAVSGLPIENNDHAIKVIKAAIEIRDYVNNNHGKFQIRIGVNSGPVVAGIVGVKKYAYDIWGDTVNTASRMEANSEPGKVNISGSTYELVHSEFNCIYRGKISAKGKGEVDMYFVDC